MELYEQTIIDLKAWFIDKIPKTSLPVVTLSRSEYALGIDALPEIFQPMRNAAFTIWLWEKEYELSYSQMCAAYFNALGELGLLKVSV